QLLRLHEQQMQEAFSPPQAIVAEIPAAASELVRRALSYRPEHRPESAKWFSEELERLLTGGR
ncbi:MAG: hypothetical protein NZ585_15120, partial [Chloracidobacterium sp.]|nr:hypothetical protein [Chloracidobacterium sp.]